MSRNFPAVIQWHGSKVHSVFSLQAGVFTTACGIKKLREDVDGLYKYLKQNQCVRCLITIGERKAKP